MEDQDRIQIDESERRLFVPGYCLVVAASFVPSSGLLGKAWMMHNGTRGTDGVERERDSTEEWRSEDAVLGKTDKRAKGEEKWTWTSK